jgi:hypothetical protein
MEKTMKDNSPMQKCLFDPSNVAATDSQVLIQINSGDENAMQVSVAQIRPLAVSIDASGLQDLGPDGIPFISIAGDISKNGEIEKITVSGFVDSTQCSADHINHAVLVVGYGTDKIMAAIIGWLNILGVPTRVLVDISDCKGVLMHVVLLLSLWIPSFERMYTIFMCTYVELILIIYQ